MKQTPQFLFLFGCLLALNGCFWEAHAQNQLLSDWKNEWLVFEEPNYVPYFPEGTASYAAPKVLHLRLDSGRWNGEELLLVLDSGTVVFENNNLHYRATEQTFFRFPLKGFPPSRLLTIWKNEGVWKQAPHTFVIRKGAKVPDFLREKETLSPQEREILFIDALAPLEIPPTLIILTWLVLLALIGLRQGDPLLFSRKSFIRALEALYKPLPELQRLGGISGLSFLFFYTLTLAYLLVLLGSGRAQVFSDFFSFSFFTLGMLATQLISIIGLAYLLFGSTSRGWLHIREHIQFSIPLLTVLLIFSILVGFAGTTPADFIFSQDWLSLTAILCLLLRTLLVCYQIFRLYKRIDLYLFSYLCTTEIVPALFMVQFLVVF